jgi:hypothetical protein
VLVDHEAASVAGAEGTLARRGVRGGKRAAGVVARIAEPLLEGERLELAHCS